MTVTIAQVLALPDLNLRVVAGDAGLGNEVRWVHVSETVDPTPWLRGGELLLTTGLKIEQPEQFEPYVHRLADAGLAGLGFGIGLGHAQVPEPLIRAAAQRGLPVLEVPVDAPYVAISEAVSNLLAAERYDTIARAFDAQQALTAAAVESGRGGIVAATARAVGGWAVLTDLAANVVRAFPPQAADRLPALLPDVMRARERGIRSSGSVVGPTESVAIHTLGARGRMRGFLVAGVPGRSSDYSRMVLAGAVALLSLEMERSQAATRQVRRLRADPLAQILRGAVTDQVAGQHATAWELDPTAVRVAVYLCAADRAGRVCDDVNELMSEAGLPGAVVAQDAGRQTRVAVLTDATDRATAALAELASVRPMVPLGLGDVVPVEQVGLSYRAATHAAEVGRAERRAVTRFDDLEALHMLFRAQSPQALAGFVRRVLGPLQQHDRGREGALLASLRSFLAHNGHWNETAAELGIHRHTLRARIDRIEQVTGRDLNSAYGRMELWLALLADSAADTDDFAGPAPDRPAGPVPDRSGGRGQDRK
ncbi:PucR family transcriptional regulator ligand-binding domain-containing protein [Polymorphospora sp. NPDC050346]|uniref:PucR family transcriptional regulator n=1 Tax=Polymorphospora sp. NPDC050346 TaxID=3155780 RepID=UPI0033C61C34